MSYAYTGQAKITSGFVDNTPVGFTTAATGRFTTVESTVPTGTAPLIIASKTFVPNLYVATTASLATSSGIGFDVDVSASAPPTVNQVLKATSATTAVWSTVSIANTLAYSLTTIKIQAINTTWDPAAYFPWLNSRYSGHTAGTVIFRANIVDRNLDIRLYDATNSVVLGSLLGIAATGTYSFTVINPTTDAEIQLQIQKTALVGTSPTITGAVLEYIA